MITLVDGDVVAFHSCPPRKRFDEEGNEIKLLDDNGYIKPIEMSPSEEAAYLDNAWKNFKINLQAIQERCFADDSLVAIGGVRNFRQDLYPNYKIHRSRASYQPNPFVPRLRDMAVEEGLAVNALGYEADDLLRMWSNQCRDNGIDFIICSVDKDLLCIPGKHYRMHKGKEAIIDVSEHEARIHYYEQLLQGDPTDNIPGVPGLGPKTAAKLIAACESEDQMREIVAERYFAAYGPDEWLNHLLINAKLIHILGTPDDYFSGATWDILWS